MVEFKLPLVGVPSADGSYREGWSSVWLSFLFRGMAAPLQTRLKIVDRPRGGCQPLDDFSVSTRQQREIGGRSLQVTRLQPHLRQEFCPIQA